ncbi:hypothetical protein HGRIS_014409 [Hohenbuehelia grisea]|uniref:Uncharacterized protein n=1 Tax=Hohenbuehelia grisea TaxID=104357 RepID=A0ABR3JVG7_9AGAR
MPEFTVATAELAGIVVHSALFGVYIVLFIGCIYVLLFRYRSLSGRHHQRPVNKVLLTVTVILFLLITAHWVLQVIRLFDAFIHRPRDETPEQIYGAARSPLNVAKTALYVAQTFTADVTMVYRLYIVWGRNWKVIIAPAITTAGLLAGGTNVVISFARQDPHVSIFTSASGHWIVTVFSTTFATNLMVTSLIAYRIWSINRLVQPSTRTSIKPVINIILESAVLYTIFLVITHMAYLAKAPFQFIFLDASSPAIGIAFSLIIVRVGLGLGTEDNEPAARSNVVFRSNNAENSFPLASVSVNVSKSVSRRVESANGDVIPDEEASAGDISDKVHSPARDWSAY